jgi:RsiW-degrading membrane proteinase PrsW (M82 family)
LAQKGTRTASLPSVLSILADKGSAMSVLGNIANWDPVLWMSILMVIIAIVIFIFLVFKIKALMKQDADAHKNQN